MGVFDRVSFLGDRAAGPGGAASAARGGGGAGPSAGIVLKRTSAEGDLYEGEEAAGDDAGGARQCSRRRTLLSALPSETAAAKLGDDLPKLPTPGAGPTRWRRPAERGPAHDRRRAARLAGGRRRCAGERVRRAGQGQQVCLPVRSVVQHGRSAAGRRQAATLESLASLESVHQFHIIFFNTKTQSFDITGGGRRIAFATDRNKQLAANFVGGITADGGTDRLTALREAIALCAGRDLLSHRCRRPDVGRASWPRSTGQQPARRRSA